MVESTAVQERSGVVAQNGVARSPSEASPAVAGRRSLVEGAASADPVETARAGTAGSGSRLPFGPQIQAAFGRHDVTGVRAHVGGAAAEASSALGGRAFAVGDAVGFASAPDLHTAAHEAAHVVQQRDGVSLAGGLDTPGDAHERHADAVADAVVAGHSAEALLDARASSGGAKAGVQRDTKGATAPPKPTAQADGSDPPPPRGSIRVEIAGANDYWFVLNSLDLVKSSNPAQTAFRYYMRDVFPGVTDEQIGQVFRANKVFFGPGAPFPQVEHAYYVHVRPDFHAAVVAAMKRIAPRVAFVEPTVGDAKLGGAGGNSGGKQKSPLDHGAGEQTPAHTDTVSTAVEIDRALYERLLKEFPDAGVLHGSAAFPELLAFLADHAEALKQVPHSKDGVRAMSVAQLKKLLEDFRRATAKGDSSGEVGGADEVKIGVKDGKDGGSGRTLDTTGIVGGSEGGTGDSKYGWVRWAPKGQIAVEPELPQYITGSEVKAKLDWDLSVHPDAALVLLANHCRYSWTVKHGGKVVDRSRTAYFHDNRDVSLDLDGGAGDYVLTVTATSKHFRTEDHEFSTTRTVKAIDESTFDKQTFDAAHVGPDATFSRDDKGKLHLNADQHALTAEQEVATNDLTRGHVDELGKEGKITSGSQQALDDELDKERAALKKVEDKTAAGTPYIVRGTFVGRENSSSETLRVLMTMTRRAHTLDAAAVSLILHDITTGDPEQHPGGARVGGPGRPAAALQQAESDALDDMANHFHAHNGYAKGTVHLAAQRLTSDSVWEKEIETNNARKKATKVMHGVAMVGGALLMVVPGTQAVAVGVILATTATATVASIAIDIQDRVAREGELKFDRRLVMDLLTVASVVMPLGAMTKVMQEASAVAKTRFALSMVALDGAQGFLIAKDVMHQLTLVEANAEQQLADATTDEERAQIKDRRNQQVSQILGGAVTSGGFMLISLGAGIHQLSVASAGGRFFKVREPVAKLGTGPRAAMEEALATGVFPHENGRVAITPEERLYLEHQVSTSKPDAAKPAEREQVPVADESEKPAHERTTQKDMKAVQPDVDPATGAQGVTFQGRGDRIGAMAKKLPPDGNYFDVVVHGDGKDFAVLHDGQWVKVKPNSVRKYIRSQPGYTGGPIRLLSCEAGAEGATTAQAVADGMGVHVKAPSEKIWLSQDKTTGDVELILGNDPQKPSGTWKGFDPGGARPKPAAPEVPVEPVAPTPGTPVPPHERVTDRQIPAQKDPSEEPARDPDPAGGAHDRVSLGKPLEPVPAADATAIRARAVEHVERVRGELVQDAPPAETERITDAVDARARETYQQSISQGRKAADARKDASEAAKAAAKAEWTDAREPITDARANAMIDDGTVFDRSKLTPDAERQLDAYRAAGPAGPVGNAPGAAGRRLSPALTGATVPAMETMLDAEVAAGNCRRVDETQPANGGATQQQATYYFKDGSVIRIKPAGDSFNNWQPSFSVEVKNAGVPAADASEQASIAFKVDAGGRAVPKTPEDIVNPYRSEYAWQRTRFRRMIAAAGHRLAP